MAPGGREFVDNTCGMPAAAEVQFLDLNRDGAPEVLVVFGNTCTSGMAGTSVVLFIKTQGQYRMNLGFPAAEVTPLDTRNRGYADLLIGGPGFCFPVWRWNGSDYVYFRSDPQEPGGCDNR